MTDLRVSGCKLCGTTFNYVKGLQSLFSRIGNTRL